jgi:hypothetical protein
MWRREVRTHLPDPSQTLSHPDFFLIKTKTQILTFQMFCLHRPRSGHERRMEHTQTCSTTRAVTGTNPRAVTGMSQLMLLRKVVRIVVMMMSSRAITMMMRVITMMMTMAMMVTIVTTGILVLMEIA